MIPISDTFFKNLTFISYFRYVTIQRGEETTEASLFTPDDSLNQVGDSAIDLAHNTEFLFSLAKFKKSHNRVKRSIDNVAIIYPSDTPITVSPTSKKPSLIVSNDISIVYPQSYNPRDDRQSFESFLTAGDLYKPAATILPVNDLTTTSFSTSMILSSSSTLPLNSTTNQSLEPSTPLDTTIVTTTEFSQETSNSEIEITTALDSETTTISENEKEENTERVPENENNEEEDDYDDWGVVVSVVKSVSESDSSVKLIQHETTPVAEYSETTTVKDEATTMHHQLPDNRTVKPKSLPFKNQSTNILHPFLTANKISNNNSTFGHHKIHPFLHQIKSPNQATTKGITHAPKNLTTGTTKISTNITTTSTQPTNIKATGLFNRFSFLNKGKRPELATPAKTTAQPVSSQTIPSKLKSLTSRLSGFKRPSFRPSSFRKHESDDLSNDIEDDEKSKSTTVSPYSLKKNSFLNRFKSKHSFLKHGSDKEGSSSTKEPPKLIDKPRPKRLPSPFGGTRPDSLFKPRPNRLFSSHHDDSKPTTTTEKQTVGDIIAQLNGDTEEDDKQSVTLRPHSFKPKSGGSSKIREHLLAELAKEKEDSDSETQSDMDKSSNEKSKNKALNLSKPIKKSNSLSRLPKTRLTSLDRKHLSPLSGRTRLKTRSKLTTTENPVDVTNVGETMGTKKILSEKTLLNKLGVTVVNTPRGHVTDVTHDSPGTEVEFVHDRESLTTIQLEDSSTNSPFQVLLDGSDDLEVDEEHEDHVHELVHEHHPEIHFRHLQPDVNPTETTASTNAPTLDMFLPTMLAHSDDDETVETVVVKEVTAPAFLPTPEQKKTEVKAEVKTDERTLTRSRGRSRYRPRPSSSSRSSSASQRTAIAEQRSKRVQLRRRNRVEVDTKTEKSDSDSDKKSEEVRQPSNDRRTLSRTRSRFRSASSSPSSNSESTTKGSSPARFSNPRRFRSRARTSVNRDNQSPKSKSTANLRTRSRGLRIRTTTEKEPESEEVEQQTPSQAVDVPPVTTSVPATEQSSTVEDGNVDILEGKFTSIDVDTTTEGVVTNLTINSIENEENSEEDQSETTVSDEVSTLRPGKFKPKFGAETRNKLREKLRQELMNNKTASNEGKNNLATVDKGDTEPLKDHLAGFIDLDTEFSDSDFDIDPTIIEAPTTAIIDFNNEAYSSFQGPYQVRSQRRAHLDDEFADAFKFRKNFPKKKRSHNSHRRQGADLLRFGRSTVTETITTEKHDSENLPPKPFLLRGGKGYKKNLIENNLSVENNFAAFRSGFPLGENSEDKISGPHINLNERFNFEDVIPSVTHDASEKSDKTNIYLDTESSTTFAPNILTTNSLNLPSKSFKSKVLKKGLRLKLKSRKFPKQIINQSEVKSVTPTNNDKVDSKRPSIYGSCFRFA